MAVSNIFMTHARIERLSKIDRLHSGMNKYTSNKRVSPCLCALDSPSPIGRYS